MYRKDPRTLLSYSWLFIEGIQEAIIRNLPKNGIAFIIISITMILTLLGSFPLLLLPCFEIIESKAREQKKDVAKKPVVKKTTDKSATQESKQIVNKKKEEIREQSKKDPKVAQEHKAFLDKEKKAKEEAERKSWRESYYYNPFAALLKK